MKVRFVVMVSLVACVLSPPAAADTSLELLYGGLLGQDFNDDFNGDEKRWTLTIKTFQPWSFGTFFMYYDITGPFTPATVDESVAPNERAGFFGGISATVSGKRIAEKIAGSLFDWGVLGDVSLRYEIEHASKYGALNYYGLQYDLRVPYLDFLSLVTVIRDDWALAGVDLQLGAAWQSSFSILDQGFVFAGFLQWGVFGEGEFKEDPTLPGGNWFFLTQPQLLWDFGKTARIAESTLYLGLEYQIALNRYLIEGKTENVLQALIKWNI